MKLLLHGGQILDGGRLKEQTKVAVNEKSP
jgi:hypothetical protein